MTLQISSEVKQALKMQLPLTRHRIWEIASCTLLSIIFYIIMPIIMYSAAAESVNTQIRSLKSALEESSWVWLCCNNPVSICGAVILGVIFGISGFAWLYKMRSVVFFESQPVRRETRFWAIILNSVIIVGVITLIGTLLSGTIALAMHAGSAMLFPGMLYSWLRLMLLFLGCHALCSLAAVVSGNTVIAVLLSAFLMGIEFVIRIIWVGAMEMYFATSYINDLFLSLRPIFSPFSIINRISGVSPVLEFSVEKAATGAEFEKAVAATMPLVFELLVFAVVVIALAFLAYCRRPAEAAHHSFAFKPCEWGIKAVVMFVSGAGTWMLVDSIFEAYTTWRFLSVCLAALSIVISAMVCEAVFAMNISAVLRRWLYIPCLGVAVLAYIFAFKMDITGFDRYTPDPADVASYMVYLPNFSNDVYYTETDDSEESTEERFRRDCIMTNIEDGIAFAKSGMKAAVKQRKLKETVPLEKLEVEDPGELEDYFLWDDVLILFRMKNGREIWRRITVDETVDQDLVGRVLSQPSYLDCLIPMERAVKMLEKYHVKSVGVNFYNDNVDKTVNVPVSEAKEILRNYRKDFDNFDYSKLVSDMYSGQPYQAISLTHQLTKEKSFSVSLRYFDWQKRTGSWLKKNNMTKK